MMNATAKCFQWQPKALSPIRQRQRLSVESDYFHVAFVPRLLKPICPAAVVWAVAAVVITAINGVLGGWPLAHVREEPCEPVHAKPLVADSNPSPAVILVVGARFMEASDLHLAPDNVLRPFVASVKAGGCRTPFVLAASTTLAMSITQDVSTNGLGVSAVTAAVPVEQLAYGLCRGKNSETAEDLSGQVFAVPRRFSLKHLCFHTPATLTPVGPESSAPYDFLSPAIATAKPRSRVSILMREPQDSPPIETQPGKVFVFSHAISISARV